MFFIISHIAVLKVQFSAVTLVAILFYVTFELMMEISNLKFYYL